MIHLVEEKIVIILSHPCPKEAIIDLQRGIIEALQYQFAHPDELPIREQQNEGNYLLLELLKATLK